MPQTLSDNRRDDADVLDERCSKAAYQDRRVFSPLALITGRSTAVTLTFPGDGKMYAYLMALVPNVVAPSARHLRSQFGILMKPRDRV
jgi:hypothetical protein